MLTRCRWLGIFAVVSAFNNCGLLLLDDNMVCVVLKSSWHGCLTGTQIPLRKNVFLLIALLFLMLAGNTA